MKWALGFLAVLASAMCGAAANSTIASRAVRTKVNGIDVVVYPMGVKDVVTLIGSLPAGDDLAERDGANLAAATFTGMMLDKGTTQQDKFAIARQLDSVGAELGFEVHEQTLGFAGHTLKKDLPRLIHILAEELRTPALSEEEFGKVKTQFAAALRHELESTSFRAHEAFLRSVFAQGHPNRPASLQDWMRASDQITVAQVRAFHKKYYGPAHMTLVFVGDVNAKAIRSEVAKAFAGWTGGVDVRRTAARAPVETSLEQKVPIAQKTSVSVILGQSTGLRYQDPDSLALRVGTAILGSGFTGRLMGTVRDREGLTYGIGAAAEEDTFVDGTWAVTASFAPKLLEHGIASTRRELQKWWESGVTAEELAARKTNMIGAFQVGLATTQGMAGAMLITLERGKPLSWLDELPKAIDALTVAQVNGAIKKYLDPGKMVLVEAGTFEAGKTAGR